MFKVSKLDATTNIITNNLMNINDYMSKNQQSIFIILVQNFGKLSDLNSEMKELLEKFKKMSLEQCIIYMAQKYPNLNNNSLNTMMATRFISDFYGLPATEMINLLTKIINYNSIKIRGPKKKHLFELIITYKTIIEMSNTFFYLKMGSKIETLLKNEIDESIAITIDNLFKKNTAVNKKNNDFGSYQKIIKNIKLMSSDNFYKYVTNVPDFSHYADINETVKSISHNDDINLMIHKLASCPIFLYLFKYLIHKIDEQKPIFDFRIEKINDKILEIII